ncbi:MAG: amidohydrolase [Abditibacteriales bacterium]|nr:amidohydrolase [Abditibacteriales bacterium]MDW8367622.1 amidohydrolase family protein [Abditibacteriales bacterium]
MIDVNAYRDSYPFRPGVLALEFDLTYRGFEGSLAVVSLLVSPLRAIFWEEPQTANEYAHADIRSYQQKRAAGAEIPNQLLVAVINPTLRNWERSLEQSHKELGAVAIKLHPNYHTYHLTDSAARELLRACGEKGLPVIVQMRMQDTRSHHPLMQVPDVDINEVLEAAAATPQTTFVIGGIKWGEASSKANDINALPNVWLDISQCEVADVLRRLIRLFGAGKLLFGTHAPLFYIKSALLKLEEARLTAEERELITERNARELFRL